jgi:predicted outer membrane repeat protein
MLHAVTNTYRSSMLTLLAGLATWLAADTALAAPCSVTEEDDDINLPGSLRYCIDQVNQGLTDLVIIQAAHWYAPQTPLVVEKSARISGYGRIVMPGDDFVGDSLFVIGTQCPGPACNGLVSVEIEGLEIAAVGVTNVRGVELRANHELVLEDVQLYEFTKPGLSGGCVRAGQQSWLTIEGSTFEGCSAGDGGAVHSEATLTLVSGSTFANNVASSNGGAIAIGTGNFFARALQVEVSTFTGNFADRGGAIKATGNQIEVEAIEAGFFDNKATTKGGAVHGKGTFDVCQFERNYAGTFGGALHFIEDATVRDSTLWSNNSVTGGGIAFQPAGGYGLRLEHSTVALNTIAGDQAYGAGVAVLGGDAVVLNSTFSENYAREDQSAAYGGGLAVLDGKVQVEHATFAHNEASLGGGIYLHANGDLSLRSSIVAYSIGKDCEVLGGWGTTTSLDTDGSCGVDYSKVDPQLYDFGDNGGLTWTWLPGAQVLGAAQCLATEDQRHEPRPGKSCDIGAVEL